jgi:hypothetical protein
MPEVQPCESEPARECVGAFGIDVSGRTLSRAGSLPQGIFLLARSDSRQDYVTGATLFKPEKLNTCATAIHS